MRSFLFCVLQLCLWALTFSEGSWGAAHRKFGSDTPKIPVKVSWTDLTHKKDKSFEMDLPLYSLAMDLAIQGFDSTHLRGFTSESSEFRIFLGVLKSVEKAVPFLSKLNRYNYAHYRDSARKFVDLSGRFSATIDQDLKENKVEELLIETEKLFAGCLFKNQYFDRVNLHETRQYELDPHICREKEIVKELNRLGYVSVQTTQKNYLRNTTEFLDVCFRSQSHKLKDPKKVIGELSQIPSLSRLARLLSSSGEKYVMGEEPVKIEVIDLGMPRDSQWVATPLMMTLVYSLGWDECLTGCKNRHYWKVRVNSLGFDLRQKKETFLSEVYLVEEYGSDLDLNHPQVSVSLSSGS